jgi:hypothetical protein
MNKLYKSLWLLVILLSALATVSSAQAVLKATNVVYAWDRASNRYQNGNVTIYWDDGWVPFIHELNFDNETTNPTNPECGGRSTKYAGALDFGLYHIDDAPAGALGFIETRRWQLVNCDLNGDGRFNNNDLTVWPTPPPNPLINSPAYTGFNELLDPYPLKDILTPCSTGNCLNEIVTTLNVNLDKNCDGVIDSNYPTNVCFFAESHVPTREDGPPYWGGNLQARISAGGGAKTVNFNPTGPTALTLVKLAANSGISELRNTVVSAGIFTVLLISLLGTNLYKRKKQF